MNFNSLFLKKLIINIQLKIDLKWGLWFINCFFGLVKIEKQFF